VPKTETDEELLQEIWGRMAGSYEDDQTAIQNSLRGSKQFGSTKEDYDISLEATFKNSVLIRNNSTSPPTYYQSSWKKDKDGDIIFSDVKTVKAEVVVKKVNEQQEVMEAVRDATGTVSLNEIFITPISLSEKTVDGVKRIVGTAQIVQRADIINGNKRRYKKSVLKEAITNLQERMQKTGPLLMDYKHRTKKTASGTEVNDRDLRETVAVIRDLKWHEADGTVSLDEIEFVDTQAGKDIQALVDKNVRLQVSQRASGAVEVMKNESTGEVFQDVTALRIDGWDFVPPGEASVKEADVQFQVVSESEVSEMAEKTIATIEEVQELIKTGNEELKAEVANMIKEGFPVESIVEALKASGAMPEEEEPEEDMEEEEEEPTPKPKKKAAKSEDEEDDTDEVVAEVRAGVKELEETVTGLTTTLGESQETVAVLKRERDLTILSKVGGDLLLESLGSEDFSRFTKEQKEAIAKSIDVPSLYGTVDITDTKAVKTAIDQRVLTKVNEMDTFVAASKLKSTGYPTRGFGGEGIAHVEVLNEPIPNGEYIHRILKATNEKLDSRMPGGSWAMPDTHPNMKFLNEVLAKYDRMNYQLLRKEEQVMNEANEEVLQLDIGVRVASLARVVIETAYRRITALQVCDVGTMTNRIEDILVSSWLPTETTDIADDMATVEIAQGGTIATGGVTYSNVPIYAVWRPLRTYISSNARATARGTAMNPEADAIAGLSLDLQRRVDRYLWNLMVAYAQVRDAVEVAAYETLVVVGATDEWASANQGWIRYEVLQSVDANGNPTGQELQKLYAIPATNVLQEVDVREAGGDNTALIYGTDYSVNWADGTITLTATGIVKEDGNDVEAKYSYSTANCNFWSVVPPVGVTLYDHLINLRQQVGQSRTLIANRNYAANYMGLSLDIEDLITSGPQFTASGATPADMLSRLNEVTNYAGLRPVKTSAIPNQWVVLGEQGAVAYRVHTPWSMRGPVTDKDTGYDYYLGEEYTGAVVPLDDKLSLVGITDLNT